MWLAVTEEAGGVDMGCLAVRLRDDGAKGRRACLPSFHSNFALAGKGSPSYRDGSHSIHSLCLYFGLEPTT